MTRSDMNKELLRKIGLGDMVDKVEAGKCPTCNEPIDLTAFRNPISQKEFGISGLCQKCQDSVFGKD